MKKHITWVLAVGLMLTGTAAFAQATPQKGVSPGPAARLHIQKRVQDGLRAGQITRGELQRLRNRLTAIRQHGKNLRADGPLTPQERQQLRRELRQASRALFAMRHNRIRR